jgi:hypothetical protein
MLEKEKAITSKNMEGGYSQVLLNLIFIERTCFSKSADRYSFSAATRESRHPPSNSSRATILPSTISAKLTTWKEAEQFL